MPKAVKKAISLPFDLATEVEEIAREEHKTVSAVIQDVLRIAREQKLKRGFRHIQGYWSSKAREKGIITEKDLQRYLLQHATW